jgi:hypothetical protein
VTQQTDELVQFVRSAKIVLDREAGLLRATAPRPEEPNRLMLAVSFASADITALFRPLNEVVSETATSCTERAESYDEVMALAVALEEASKTFVEAAAYLRGFASHADEAKRPQM